MMVVLYILIATNLMTDLVIQLRSDLRLEFLDAYDGVDVKVVGSG